MSEEVKDSGVYTAEDARRSMIKFGIPEVVADKVIALESAPDRERPIATFVREQIKDLGTRMLNIDEKTSPWFVSFMLKQLELIDEVEQAVGKLEATILIIDAAERVQQENAS